MPLSDGRKVSLVVSEAPSPLGLNGSGLTLAPAMPGGTVSMVTFAPAGLALPSAAVAAAVSV